MFTHIVGHFRISYVDEIAAIPRSVRGGVHDLGSGGRYRRIGTFRLVLELDFILIHGVSSTFIIQSKFSTAIFRDVETEITGDAIDVIGHAIRGEVKCRLIMRPIMSGPPATIIYSIAVSSCVTNNVVGRLNIPRIICRRLRGRLRCPCARSSVPRFNLNLICTYTNLSHDLIVADSGYGIDIIVTTNGLGNPEFSVKHLVVNTNSSVVSISRFSIEGRFCATHPVEASIDHLGTGRIAAVLFRKHQLGRG